MKFQFLSCALSPPGSSLLESVKLEILRRPDCREVFRAEEADAIVLQEATSFKDWRYIETLLADPMVGKFPHKTYTINTDDGATGLLRGIYTSLPAHRFDARFHRTVPYASSPIESFYPRWRQNDERPPKFLGSWRGNLKSNPLRRKLKELLKTNPRFAMETTESWFDHPADEKAHYVDLLLSAKFSLCPAGWAGVTFRIYESMALGVAPVLIADSFVPPHGPDWASFSITFPEKNYRNVESILARNENRYLEIGLRARAAWERYFSPPTVFGCYADALIECIRADGPGSRDTELQRWRSWKMSWSNHWTLLQRIENKLRHMARR